MPINISNLSSFEKFFLSDFWPDYLFINNYPVLVIFWNIFLLFVPYSIVKFLVYYWKLNNFIRWREKIAAGAFFILWLLFIPNSAYIITDMRHITGFCPGNDYLAICSENAWMIMFFFVYAIIGWVAFVCLMNQMKNLIKIIFNKFIAEIFIIAVMPVITLGLLLGLINRWNSWEMFAHPIKIINDSVLYFTQFLYFRDFVIFLFGLYALYFLGNWLFNRSNSK
ncbi:MAG: DUF1361 domain-containing protein [Patescibacteria group bacterium]|nr:DUF1361 domain-containing protein [Patescibacteria group bacterium]MDD4610848.1 DUF1361 domain-containing protein [Patescibacteria group bacterium]